MKLNPKNQLTQNSKSILASSLALLVCTPVQAQPFSPLLLEQSLTFNPLAAPDKVGSFSPQAGSLILAAPLPPTGTGAPRRPGPGAGGRIFQAPRPPRGTGAPRRRRGGGSRGCEVQNPVSEATPLTALVPEVTDATGDVNSVGGYTTAERPTFWFYIPYQPPIAGQFVLRSQDGTLVYRTNVTLPAKPGAIAVSLPDSVPSLTPGKPYYWYFKVYCQPGSSPFSFVEGWIERTALNPSVESQLQNATPQQKVALYASNGIWYEALTIAAELYRNNPKDTTWAKLLQDVGLGEIASEASVER